MPNRLDLVLNPDPSRVLFKAFDPGNRERIIKIIARVMVLSDAEVEAAFEGVIYEFDRRHISYRKFLLRRFAEVGRYVITDAPLSEARKLLIGAYFTQEYSLEAAALFNPSIMPHPDQSGLKPGELRFILSLRATGEGHISSITFRTGILDAQANVSINTPSRFVTAAMRVANPDYHKPLFTRKLLELGLLSPLAVNVLAQLGESFSGAELESALNHLMGGNRFATQVERETAEGILSLANANYTAIFDEAQSISERVLFPSSAAEMRGIEDARFTLFDDGGDKVYYATYTAYDGRVLLPQILETRDFREFRISTLNGSEVQNKGMALFPRKINGMYAMVSRQDNENLYLMYSDHPHFWYEKQPLLRPTFPWEFVQIGNCGAPIETSEGWLLLTHGVGHMRKYTIGAALLDLDDPLKIRGRLREPLLTPNEKEREGYVPNVVYSCGGLIHAGQLVMPYAMSDQASSFARFDLAELLDRLLKSK